MKKIAVFLALTSAFVLLSGLACADPLFYIDFDRKPDMHMDPGDIYPIEWDERATSVTAIFADGLSGADGPDISVPNGDGVDFPDTFGPQGGRVLFIESGQIEEGFNIEMSDVYDIGDYTVEVCFWISTNDLTNNSYTLQNIWTNAWPWGDGFSAILRVIGSKAADWPISRPDDVKTLELAIFQPDGEKRINTSGEISAQEWHTSQMVFDYNEADPTNCTISAYLDGSLTGTATYDCTVTGTRPDTTTVVTNKFWPTWGTPSTDGARYDIGSYRYFLGCSESRQVNFTDWRGMKGAIDAFCISGEALSPGEFVLPGGFNPPAPTSADSWAIYE